jgi:hypothetical protein
MVESTFADSSLRALFSNDRMALVAQTIYSFYKPKDSEDSVTVAHDINDDGADESHWDRAATSGGLKPIPPRFVPARIPIDEYGRPQPLESTQDTCVDTPGAGPSVSSWYRSLTSNLPKHPPVDRPSSAPIPHKHIVTTTNPTGQGGSSKSVTPPKQDWFTSSHPQYTKPPPPPESIAEKLSREPPADVPKKPKVWIALGPANKGYEMLSRGGWVEGEGLGAKAGIGMHFPCKDNRVEVVEVEDEEVIDVTVSSDENDAEDDFLPSASTSVRSLISVKSENPAKDDSELPSGGIRLLVPLSTTLKSDRLGIGLNAKYLETPAGIRIPTRRITHGQKAVQAHSKAAEEARKMRQKWGRGTRGQQRRQKAESLKHQELIAYMNS